MGMGRSAEDDGGTTSVGRGAAPAKGDVPLEAESESLRERFGIEWITGSIAACGGRREWREADDATVLLTS